MAERAAQSQKSSRLLSSPSATSIQTVDLQTHRRRARALDGVEHADDIGVRKRAWSFYEDSLFDARIVWQVGPITQLVFVSVIQQALLKHVHQRRRKFARIVNRPHVIGSIQHQCAIALNRYNEA